MGVECQSGVYNPKDRYYTRGWMSERKIRIVKDDMAEVQIEVLYLQIQI